MPAVREQKSSVPSVGPVNSVEPKIDSPLLTVIVPAYNEVATIGELLRRVGHAPFDKEILVVDDGSTDGTAETLKHCKTIAEFRVLRHRRNRGKGASVRTALAHARGRYTIVQDGDLETDPRDYGRLIEPLLSGRADAVFGSRFLSLSQRARARLSAFRLGVSVLNVATRLIYGLETTDEACAYKVFSTATLRAMDLECRRFELCPELVAKACRMKLCIEHVPVSYCPRDHRSGKKIRYRDGFEALLTLWRWRNWKPPPGWRSGNGIKASPRGRNTTAASGQSGMRNKPVR